MTSTLASAARVTLLLAGLGVVAGGMAALLLNALGTVAAQSVITNGVVIYHWNIIPFMTTGAVGTPILAWAALRRAPLWRAVLEPAVGALIGTFAGLAAVPLFGSPFVLPALLCLGIVSAAARLRWRFRPAAARAIAPTLSLLSWNGSSAPTGPGGGAADPSSASPQP